MTINPKETIRKEVPWSCPFPHLVIRKELGGAHLDQTERQIRSLWNLVLAPHLGPWTTHLTSKSLNSAHLQCRYTCPGHLSPGLWRESRVHTFCKCSAELMELIHLSLGRGQARDPSPRTAGLKVKRKARLQHECPHAQPVRDSHGKGRDTGVVRQTREAFTVTPSEIQKASLTDKTRQEEVPSPSTWAQGWDTQHNMTFQTWRTALVIYSWSDIPCHFPSSVKFPLKIR